MRKHPSAMVAMLAIVMLILAACNGGGESPGASDPASMPPASAPAESVPASAPASLPAESAAASADFSACMVSDVGGIDDNSFNENAWLGMQNAEAELGIEVNFLESGSAEDYARNIQTFVDQDCDMIVTVGFLLGDATAAAAAANPDTRFAIVDFAYEEPIPNVEGLLYSTAEGAMLAGYASASWSQTGILGTFGGINIGPGVTDFMDGFIAGVNYWNEQQSADVSVLGGRDPNDPDSGTFTGDFESLDIAANITNDMLQEGADVILPVGGPIGGGTFTAIQDSGAEAVGLGVDVDWTLTTPEFTDLILTSIIKRIDNSVFQAVERAVNGDAPEPVFLSTLENEGVGIAPFHEYEDVITQEVKDEIAALSEAIIAGEIAPADYYGE